MTNRRGVTLVEVLVAVSILGLALAPVVGMFHKSFGDIRAEKDEANAAAVAGQILNQILFEAKFKDVLANSYTSPGPPSEVILPSGNKTVDGTFVDWTVTSQPVANLKFLFRRLKYHPKDLGPEPVPASLDDVAKFYQDLPSPPGSGTCQFNRQAGDLDAKYKVAPYLGTVLLEVMLKIRWRPPGAATFTKEEALYVRRAMLE